MISPHAIATEFKIALSLNAPVPLSWRGLPSPLFSFFLEPSVIATHRACAKPTTGHTHSPARSISHSI